MQNVPRLYKYELECPECFRHSMLSAFIYEVISVSKAALKES
jgi:hypothetical protein